MAAAAAAFAITGGVLGFSGWPGAPASGSAPALNVARLAAAPAANRNHAAAPALQLATPAALGGLATTVRRSTGGRSTGPGGITPAGGPQDTPSGTPPGIAVPPVAPPAAPPSALAAAAISATSATSNTLKAVGSALPIAAPVTDLTAGVVDNAGAQLGRLLQSLPGQR